MYSNKVKVGLIICVLLGVVLFGIYTSPTAHIMNDQIQSQIHLKLKKYFYPKEYAADQLEKIKSNASEACKQLTVHMGKDRIQELVTQKTTDANYRISIARVNKDKNAFPLMLNTFNKYVHDTCSESGYKGTVTEQRRNGVCPGTDFEYIDGSFQCAICDDECEAKLNPSAAANKNSSHFIQYGIFKENEIIAIYLVQESPILPRKITQLPTTQLPLINVDGVHNSITTEDHWNELLQQFKSEEEWEKVKAFIPSEIRFKAYKILKDRKVIALYKVAELPDSSYIILPADIKTYEQSAPRVFERVQIDEMGWKNILENFERHNDYLKRNK